MAKAQPNGTRHSFSYGNRTIRYLLAFNERKTLGISVLPDQSVHVKAPSGKPMEEVFRRVKRHAAWIIKQIDHFERFQPLQPPRQYVGGETHIYLGRQYRLKVIQDKNESVKLIGRFLYVRTKNKDNRRKIRALVEDWYDLRARSVLKRRLEECLKVAEVHGISEPRFRYRKMLCRWGSCNKHDTITLNTELVKAPVDCIDYVIVHELCHTKHKNHGPAFYWLLSAMMPDWERRKLKLCSIAV